MKQWAFTYSDVEQEVKKEIIRNDKTLSFFILPDGTSECEILNTLGYIKNVIVYKSRNSETESQIKNIFVKLIIKRFHQCGHKLKVINAIKKMVDKITANMWCHSILSKMLSALTIEEIYKINDMFGEKRQIIGVLNANDFLQVDVNDLLLYTQNNNGSAGVCIVGHSANCRAIIVKLYKMKKDIKVFTIVPDDYLKIFNKISSNPLQNFINIKCFNEIFNKNVGVINVNDINLVNLFLMFLGKMTRLEMDCICELERIVFDKRVALKPDDMIILSNNCYYIADFKQYCMASYMLADNINSEIFNRIATFMNLLNDRYIENINNKSNDRKGMYGVYKYFKELYKVYLLNKSAFNFSLNSFVAYWSNIVTLIYENLVFKKNNCYRIRVLLSKKLDKKIYANEFFFLNIELLDKCYSSVSIIEEYLIFVINYVEKNRIIDVNALVPNSFLQFVISVAIKWSDYNLTETMAEILILLYKRNLLVERLNIKSELIANILGNMLEKRNVERKCIIMIRKIFISYTKTNHLIAEKMHEELYSRGYDVIMDEVALGYFDNIEGFMKQIKSVDYVVPIISDAYLKRYNCLYELSELVKREDFAERTMPVVIRSKEMTDDDDIFSLNYNTKIIKYWQNQGEELDNQLKNIDRKNVAELDFRYRKIIGFSADIAQIMNFIINHKCFTMSDVVTAKKRNSLVRDFAIVVDDIINERG